VTVTFVYLPTVVMISLLLTSRRLQSRLYTRSLCLSSQSTSDISSFINQISILEKKNKWTDISEALNSAENKQDIIQKTFVLCAENIEAIQSQKKKNTLWQIHPSKLPPCTYHSLIRASATTKDLDQLTALLSEAKADARVASVIGISGLFKYYKPFLNTADSSAQEVNGGGKPEAFVSEIESRIMGHFFQWVPHMDRESTLVQSQLLFNKMYALYRNDLGRMLGFMENITISSTDKNSLSAYDFLTSIDNDRASSFSLAAYDFLAAHDVSKATVFLNNAKAKGIYLVYTSEFVLYTT
jgi:hypothetical protein